MFFVHFAIVLLCILVGARIGGIGLGVMGGLGLLILTFGFGLAPASIPIDVMLMILSVVSAAAAMQAAGGLDYMVKIATRLIHRHPKYITFIAPAVTYTFTIFAGTGHVAYSVLPVIAEVSRKNGIRPERPLSMAVIASQFAIVGSPIAAAVLTVIRYLDGSQVSVLDILKITIPATVLGIFFACIIVNKLGKELNQDPIYLARLENPEYRAELLDSVPKEEQEQTTSWHAKFSVFIFIVAAISVVILGAFAELRPVVNGKPLSMVHAIEIIMLAAGAIIILCCKPDNNVITRGSVFHAGMRAVIAIFGIAWLGDTLIAAHLPEVKETVSSLVHAAPWAFALALFVFSVLVNSQAATVTVLFPIGLSIGLPPEILVGTFVAVNGYFFVPNYGPIIAACDFDITGTTKIGKYIFNHSFMIPGLLSMVFSLALSLLFVKLYF
ncbi:anaerobic C4-dicarboxylate transporter family protein [Psittacicella gerlachiana]|uniref:C4-dicarboxylate transporter n=1 Tax=Psittacicella gerlachiana TaxID=2028574 RepID=A0A3A1YEZ1_9GAMM|nr:anaerobic C4-dicarboxylate transporter [Psittacicella gerlachiana]RIY36732.1 C4-dicarboxylate ABC transporter [Psittacicella gerlachiana]